ncbi:MAG: hypothetical protein ACI8RZ_000555 [Myxococcota bacterium]|jgi:hypothetical protein
MRICLLMVALLTGCDDTTFEAHSSEGGGTDATGYAGTVEIVATSCLEGCHAAASQAGGLDLETDFCGSTVGVPSIAYAGQGNLIEAGDSASSVFYLKLIGADNVGSVMPIGSALDEATIAVIGAWIDEGASCDESTDTDTGGTDSGGGDAGYDFATVVSDVWPRCTSCHFDGGTAVPHFGDDPGNLIDQSSNYYSYQTLVVPGDPEASFLYQKVRGTHEGSGGAMPPSGDPLSTDQLTALYGWILELEK